MRSTLYLVLVFVVAGCSKSEPIPTRKQAPAGSAASSPSTAVAPGDDDVAPRSSPPSRELMKDHFTTVIIIRDALIVGNLKLAKWNASFLAKHESDSALASWIMHVDQLRALATKVADAPSLEVATTASAELAVECGRCHAANAVTPVFPTVDRRVPASGFRPHMQRHQWAAEQMWDGLIGPSETRWNDGVAELAETPLGQDSIFTSASATPEITKLATDVHALGAEGRKATSWNERAAIYGRLLTSCAACHAAIPPATR